MNYEEMSDFEINKWVWRLAMNGKTMYCHGDTIYKESTRYNEFNPCNNPSDAWPIILANGICINKSQVRSSKLNKGDWYADTGVGLQMVFDDNPLRAACICFLKMKDAQL